MNARLRHFRLAVGSIAALLPIFLPVAARAQGSDNSERILVTIFQSADKQMGAKAAAAVREKLGKEYDPRDVWVIPTSDINNTLTASGYSTTEALTASDAHQLAVQVRADQYVDGTVTQTPTGVRINARMVLTRDMSLAQALPVAEAPTLDKAAAQVVAAVKDARRQMPGEVACYHAYREGNYQEAISQARKTLSETPNATLTALCLGDAYASLKQQDSVRAIGERIIAQDPRNIPALRWLADVYQAGGDSASKARRMTVLTQLVAADPTNLQLQQQVANELAASGQASLAVPVILQLVQSNPSDPGILKTGWLILLAANEYQRAIAVGSELVRLDTTAADSAYFVKTAVAYSSLHQLDSASRVLSAAGAKFPRNAAFPLIRSQILLRAAQDSTVDPGRRATYLQAASAAAREALAIDPNNANANVLLIQTLGSPDDVYAALQRSMSASGDKTVLGQLALQQAGTAINLAQQSKARADYQRALKFAQLSDQLSASVDAKYISGLAAYYIAEGAINDAVKSNSCSLARMAQDNFTIVQTTLPEAGGAHPQEASQVLGAVQQYSPTVSQAIKAFCK